MANTTGFWNPFSTTDTNSWWQACSAPWQAQSAYWQTVQTMMQQRLRTAQGMTEMSQLACQGLQAAKTPSDVAAVLSAWWGVQGKSIAVLNADTQGAANHLWEQWQKSFPMLDKSVWAQQYAAWQKACAGECAPRAGTTMTKSMASTSSATSSFAPAPTSTASSYMQPRGSFIRTGITPAVKAVSPTVTAAPVVATPVKAPVVLGPTAPGTAPRSVAKAPEMAKLPLTAPAPAPVVKVGVITLKAPVSDETESTDNVTPLSSRTRMTATQHAPLAAASASARRSVAARRQSKTRRVVR